MTNNSSGSGESRSIKRGSQDSHHSSPGSSSPTGSSAKRPRIEVGRGPRVDAFSLAERTILQNAANILEVPLERLLATSTLASSLNVSSESRHSPGSSGGGVSIPRLHHDGGLVSRPSTAGNGLLAPPGHAQSRAPRQAERSRSRSRPGLNRRPSNLDTIQALSSGTVSSAQSNVFPWLECVANENPQPHVFLPAQHPVATFPSQRHGPTVCLPTQPIEYSPSTDVVDYTPATTTASGSPNAHVVPPYPLPGEVIAVDTSMSTTPTNIILQQLPIAVDTSMSTTPTNTVLRQLPVAVDPRIIKAEMSIAPTPLPSHQIEEIHHSMDIEQGDEDALQISAQGEQSSSSDGKSRTPRGKRLGPYVDMNQKHETSVTRKIGACVRCSMQRIRCNFNPDDPNGCCLTCIQATRTRMYRLPCLRYRISEAELLDHVGAPRASWTFRWKKFTLTEIKGWESRTIKTITVTQDVCGAEYDFRVRRFAPLAGDALARRWKTRLGVEEKYECEPYGIASMQEAAVTLSAVVNGTLDQSICYYIDESDKLLRNTYLMAHRYSILAEREEERLLLRAALRLWNGCRMESRSERISGPEHLGMTQHFCSDISCPNQGNILLPPVFSAQLEVIMTVKVLAPAKQEVLKRLKDLIQENQRKSWFAIYLCMFVLLHSCAMLTAGDNAKARKQGVHTRFFRHSIVQGLHNGAKILLAYFHYCNKGGHPFNIDWNNPDEMTRSEFDPEQVQFMRETVIELGKKAERFRKIRQEGIFEDDYYFLSQLYDFDWKPVHTI